MPNFASASRLLLIAGCLMMSACVGTGTGTGPSVSNAPPASILDEKGRIQMRLAESAREAGNFPYAAKLYRTLAAGQPGNAPLHVALGDTLTGAGDFEAAAEAYRDAIAIDRFNADARLGLGRVAMQLRQPDLAVVQFGAVVNQSPGDVRGRVGLGVALDTLGQHAEAQAEYRQALRVLANEMRRERLVKFEEKAARLPVLITLPMIGFILPCVFIVVAGPAALDLVHLLSTR